MTTEFSKNQSNPFSTGGGGSNFETRVQAAFVVLMLTKGAAPCLPPWPITKMKLQGRDAGFNTDDFVVFVEGSKEQQKAKLLAQVKHDISITEKNETFGEVIQAAWNDFNDSSLFEVGIDVLALITGPLSATDTNHVRPLLEWARHTENEREFWDKVNTANFSSEAKRAKLQAFRTQLTKANGDKEISDKQLWEFLKSFYLLGYDLDVDAGTTQALLESLISQNSSGSARLLWSRILTAVQSANQNAGTITLEGLPQDIRDAFDSASASSAKSDLEKLREHGEYVLEGIESSIGGIHIERQGILSQLLEASETSNFVFLVGERGCGKSGIARKFAKYMKDRAPVFCFRTEDFNKPHLDNVFSEIGLNSSIGELEASFALMPKKFLLLESLEKLLELDHSTAFTDLLRFLKHHQDWTVIATGRDYAYQQIAFNYLQASDIDCKRLVVSNFDDNEARTLFEAFEPLKEIAANPSLSPLLKNPFIANLAYRVSKAGTQFSKDDGEKQFREAVWRDVIAKESVQKGGLHLRRKRTFTDIAVARAKKMVFGVSEEHYDPEALTKLEDENLIRRDKGLVSPAHDVLEDWALEQYIENMYQANNDDVVCFLDTVGDEPAMNRAFRLWLHQKLVYGDNVNDLVFAVLNSKQVQQHWQDEAMAAVLLGDEPHNFLNKLRSQLLENNGAVLKRFCFILRIACKVPNLATTEQAGVPDYLFLKPYGKGWGAIVDFLLANKEALSETMVPHVVAVLDEWTSSVRLDEALPAGAREVGLLALHFLNILKASYRDNGDRKKIIEVIIKTVPVIQSEFNELLQNDVLISRNSRRRPPYTKDFCKAALVDISTAFLCKHVPDTVAELALHEWLIDDSENDDEPWGWNRKDVEECFGLYSHRYKFFPPSGAKGPFQYLLRFHPRKGLDFLLKLFNLAAEKYAHSDLDDPSRYSPEASQDKVMSAEQVEIRLNDGTVVEQYCAGRLWGSYRGLTVTPHLLESALMALENWLIAFAEFPESSKWLEWAFDYILRNSNSVMPTAVLASVVVGFPDKVGRAALPLLKEPMFYDLDLSRRVHEMGQMETDWFAMSHDPFRELYAEERREAALRPWRREDLEVLLTRLQFSELRDEALEVVDELHAKAPQNESWRFRFHRVDSRNWEAEADSENDRIIFKPKSLEPELEEIQRQTQEETVLNSRFMRLHTWSTKTFARETLDTEYFPNWREALAETKSLVATLKNEETSNLAEMHHGGIVKAVGTLLRDYSAELSKEDAAWCIEFVTETLKSAAESGDVTESPDKIDYHGIGAAASVTPIFLDFAEDNDKQDVKTFLVAVLTHNNATICEGMANGVREQLWQRDPDFAQRCFLGVLEYARLSREDAHRIKHPRRTLTPDDAEMEEKENVRVWTDKFRSQLVGKNELSSGEDIKGINLRTHDVEHLLNACLMIPDGSTEPVHMTFLSRMLTLFFKDEELREKHLHDEEQEIEIHYELPLAFSRRFAEYLIEVPKSEIQPLIEKLKEGCDSAPSFIDSLLKNIAVRAERTQRKELYWKIWGMLSTKAQAIAHEITQYDQRAQRDRRRELIRGMLHADTPWQKVDYEDQDISLGKDLIIEFAQNAGKNPDVFDSLASLIYHFPSIFLQPGLKVLAKHQAEVGGTHLLSGVNTVFYLERSIQRFLQNDETGPLPRDIHQTCRMLLNALVEKASPRAYYLREQLVRSRRIL